jgi:hypothetical protein
MWTISLIIVLSRDQCGEAARESESTKTGNPRRE